MTRECLIDAAKAAEALGTDKDFRKQIEKTLPRLLPYQVGQKGNLQEWFHDWEDQEPQHRHQSHLFGLYPGHHLSVKETPELAKACARTLEIKGDNTTAGAPAGVSTFTHACKTAKMRTTFTVACCVMSVRTDTKERMHDAEGVPTQPARCSLAFPD